MDVNKDRASLKLSGKNPFCLNKYKYINLLYKHTRSS